MNDYFKRASQASNLDPSSYISRSSHAGFERAVDRDSGVGLGKPATRLEPETSYNWTFIMMVVTMDTQHGPDYFLLQSSLSLEHRETSVFSNNIKGLPVDERDV